mgnify:CR=1 FL=1
MLLAIVRFQVFIPNALVVPQDTCNRKSNQQNLGTIKSSNLCTEIIEYTSPTETAVCNLASIALPRFVREKVYLVSALADFNPKCCMFTCLIIRFCCRVSP